MCADCVCCRTKKKKMRPRQRTQFCEVQTKVLEETFKSCNYPSIEMKRILSEQLKLPEHRVTVWFQNRRAKQRRHHRKGDHVPIASESQIKMSEKLLTEEDQSKSWPHVTTLNNWNSESNIVEPLYPIQTTSNVQQPWSPLAKPTQPLSNPLTDQLNFNFGNGFMFDPTLNFSQAHVAPNLFDNNLVLWNEYDTTKVATPIASINPAPFSQSYYHTSNNYHQLWTPSAMPNNINLSIQNGSAFNYANTAHLSLLNN